MIVDEAHRSHYDDLDGYARHLKDALPHATLIAFTGTPISFADRNTREVFGDYIDVYDLTRAVEDGATVPVYFEPRLITVGLAEGVSEENLDESADEATTGLDDVERDRVEKARRRDQRRVRRSRPTAGPGGGHRGPLGVPARPRWGSSSTAPARRWSWAGRARSVPGCTRRSSTCAPTGTTMPSTGDGSRSSTPAPPPTRS